MSTASLHAAKHRVSAYQPPAIRNLVTSSTFAVKISLQRNFSKQYKLSLASNVFNQSHQWQREENSRLPRSSTARDMISKLATNTTKKSYFSSLIASKNATAAAAAASEDKDSADAVLQEGAINEDNIMDHVVRLASGMPTPLSLENMYRYASVDPQQRLRNAQFLHRELPIRISQRIMDLLTLPNGLCKTEPVLKIVAAYESILIRLMNSPHPETLEEEKAFTALLETFLQDRTTIPQAIAEGVKNLHFERRKELDVQRIQQMEDALYRFFTARVGLRFLVEHHILSQGTKRNVSWNKHRRDLLSDEDSLSVDGDSDFMGCIQKNCDPAKNVRKVASDVTRLARETYGVSPEIEVLDCTSEQNAKRHFTYVPHHLQYMLTEMLKNSVRAVVKRHLDGHHEQSDQVGGTLSSAYASVEESSLPSILVVVVKGEEDVTIKIADRGGGVPRSMMHKVFNFAHSTVSSEQERVESTTEWCTSDDPCSNQIRGFGLPLARIYAQYFGGELTLKSMEGYGVDAYLYLPVLGKAIENLPSKATTQFSANSAGGSSPFGSGSRRMFSSQPDRPVESLYNGINEREAIRNILNTLPERA